MRPWFEMERRCVTFIVLQDEYLVLFTLNYLFFMENFFLLMFWTSNEIRVSDMSFLILRFYRWLHLLALISTVCSREYATSQEPSKKVVSLSLRKPTSPKEYSIERRDSRLNHVDRRWYKVEIRVHEWLWVDRRRVWLVYPLWLKLSSSNIADRASILPPKPPLNAVEMVFVVTV